MISINPDVKLIRKMENLSRNELKKQLTNQKKLLKKHNTKIKSKLLKNYKYK